MPPDHIIPEIWFPNLGIYFERVPQHIFTIGNFSIYWYAVCIVLGIASAYALAAFTAKRSGQKPDDYTDILMLGVPMAFLGLRLYYMAFNWDLFRGQNFFVALIDIRGGGLAIYGGIIGAILAGVIMCAKKKISFRLVADTCAPSLLLGQVIGRFGNFFNREAFGGYTNNLFAMRIQEAQARGVIPQELLDNAILYRGMSYLQVHPTFLYEAGLNLILMIALILYRPYKKFDGEVMLMYFLGYGIIRFFVEGLRTDQLILWNTGLPVSQVVSVLFGVIALGLIVFGRLKAPKVKSR